MEGTGLRYIIALSQMTTTMFHLSLSQANPFLNHEISRMTDYTRGTAHCYQSGASFALSGIRVAGYLVFYAMLCISLFVLLSFSLLITSYIQTLPTSKKNLKIWKREPEMVSQWRTGNTMIKRKWRKCCIENYRLNRKIEQLILLKPGGELMSCTRYSTRFMRLRRRINIYLKINRNRNTWPVNFLG